MNNNARWWHDELEGSDIKGRNPFKDLRVRRAVYQAINIELIVQKVLRGQGTPTANEMMQRTLDAMRLEAQIAKDMDAYQKRPKRRFVGARAEEYRFARYVEDWRLKVERVGNLNYPEAARQNKFYGSLLITVSIRADGTVENVEINRSSGNRVLDAAAVQIVRMAAPYAQFPPDIRRDTDVLHVTRTWTFTKADELVSQ